MQQQDESDGEWRWSAAEYCDRKGSRSEAETEGTWRLDQLTGLAMPSAASSPTATATMTISNIVNSRRTIRAIMRELKQDMGRMREAALRLISWR